MPGTSPADDSQSGGARLNSARFGPGKMEEQEMAKLRHLAIAAKDPDAMAEFYKKAFDFKEVRKTDGPLAYGYHLSDGTIDLAILKFKTDQLAAASITPGCIILACWSRTSKPPAKSSRVSAASITWTRPRPDEWAASRSIFTDPRASCSTSPSIPGPAPSRCRPRPKPPNRPAAG